MGLYAVRGMATTTYACKQNEQTNRKENSISIKPKPMGKVLASYRVRYDGLIMCGNARVSF